MSPSVEDADDDNKCDYVAPSRKCPNEPLFTQRIYDSDGDEEVKDTEQCEELVRKLSTVKYRI